MKLLCFCSYEQNQNLGSTSLLFDVSFQKQGAPFSALLSIQMYFQMNIVHYPRSSFASVTKTKIEIWAALPPFLVYLYSKNRVFLPLFFFLIRGIFTRLLFLLSSTFQNSTVYLLDKSQLLGYEYVV